MLQRHEHTSLLTFLLAMACLCAPAFAGQVAGVTVDVPNEQGSFVGDHIVDGDSATAWVGGGKGIGPGKYVELFFEGPVTLESLRIYNGNQAKGQFDRYRRVTKGVILYPDDNRQKFKLKPSPGAQTVKLEPKTVSSIKLIITGVAPSAKDKALGKAKVAISEITVFGSACEGEDCTAEAGADEAEEPVTTETAAGDTPVVKVLKPEPELEPKAVKQPKSEPATIPKVESESAKKPAEKKAVATVSEKASAKKVEVKKQTGSKKAKTVTRAEPKKQVASAKAGAKKPAPKQGAAKKTGKKKAAPQQAQGITCLRKAHPVPADKDLAVGVINPWLDLELVAQMKRYFALLTTLHDRYPDIFTSDIREREGKKFVALQEDMRARREFNQHSIAMLEHIGLNFDKPETSGDITTVRVHGPYRYYLVNDAFEFQVDTLFSLRKENGKWLISNVQDR